MGNQVFEAARTVMAVREYQDRELPADVIRRVAEAGQLTASASNVQPWHFIVVRERDALHKLGSMLRTGPYVASASAAIIVAYEKQNRLAVSDASRAIQSMILTAWGDGVASNWVGFAGMDAVCKEFGLPDAYDVAGGASPRLPEAKGRGQEEAKAVQPSRLSGALRRALRVTQRRGRARKAH
jgi:nitroreductase